MVIVIEALARTHTQLAAVDHILNELRGNLGIGDLGEEQFGQPLIKLTACKVHQSEGAFEGIAGAKGGYDGGINILGAGISHTGNIGHLAEHRKGDAVEDEAGDGLVEDGDLLAHIGEQFFDDGNRFVGGLPAIHMKGPAFPMAMMGRMY